ncbi:hypothetical protein FGG08_004213 [Glutinoglossum americanum]|uniref:Queuosine 5'-phosphate N-glycosylase/hydrolase n=1 Tax=Glutinoglossum americanum TaxID=1670608 RepID=A0A9P8I5J0_9PEZI|nr:hypothetical protein FGG08_004213 [Glutinoglossum americanum]
MSDDEIDLELLALLRQSLGGSINRKNAPAETKVLEGARYIYNNSIDVALDSQSTKAAAESIWTSMQHKEYSIKTWSTHELHPKAKNEDTRFGCRFLNCIDEAGGSAAALVNLLAENFPCFNDEQRFEGRRVRFYKRAQILVADLWACFEGESYGKFHDINEITMFAGCSIWCVELIKAHILQRDPDAKVNAVLLDFYLYDTMKEKEAAGDEGIPHHRTRGIWY